MTLLELTEAEIKGIIDPALKSIPAPQTVLHEALASIEFKKLESDYIRTHFSEMMQLVEVSAFNKFKVYQKKAIKPVIKNFMERYEKDIMNKASDQRDFVVELLNTFMPVAVSFEFRTSQMRKTRAGSTLEYVTEYLLNKIGIPCQRTSQKLRDKLNRMDIVIPDETTALKKSDQAMFLSCKHTLRERWKQAIPEKNRNWIMYLITMDDDIPDKKAKEIHDHNLIIYVKDDVKGKSYLAKKDWIRKLSDLPADLKTWHRA